MKYLNKVLYLVVLFSFVIFFFGFSQTSAKAQCGDMHRYLFPHWIEEWPSEEEGRTFCSSGRHEFFWAQDNRTYVNSNWSFVGVSARFIPDRMFVSKPETFPQPGQYALWTCTEGNNKSYCYTQRSTEGVSCGLLGGYVFDYAEDSWPSGTGTQSFCGPNAYIADCNNVLQPAATTQPDIPPPSGETTWCCARIVPGCVNAPPRNFTAQCSATREGPCGSLHRSHFRCEDEEWPNTNFCLDGHELSSSSQPDFPSLGDRTEWRCSYGENLFVDCHATRDREPRCGSYHGVYEYEDERWPSGDYCTTGITNTRPSFPDAGETVNWECSYSGCSEPCEATRHLPLPWIATRGGLVHSGGDVDLAVHLVVYNDITSLKNLDDYRMEEDEKTSFSTELLTIKGTDLSLRTSKYFYSRINYPKPFIEDIGWYESLLETANIRDPRQEMWAERSSSPSEAELQTNCKNKDGGYVYFIDGDLTVNPEHYEELAPKDTLAGCIFVVKGNIYISGGKYQSDGEDFPHYDLVRGYFISDKTIHILEDDAGGEEDVKDGLKVVGGLFATGRDSFDMQRELRKEDNVDYPTLIIFHDARYLNIASKVLGNTVGESYIKDVGLKF